MSQFVYAVMTISRLRERWFDDEPLESVLATEDLGALEDQWAVVGWPDGHHRMCADRRCEILRQTFGSLEEAREAVPSGYEWLFHMPPEGPCVYRRRSCES